MLFIAGFSALWQVNLQATEAGDELTEADYLQELPLVASATRLPQPITDTPVAMTVLDRETIAASGFVEIGDLFRLVPGFQVGLSWRDHHTAVTYHGQTDGLSRRMQVLIDGRVAYTSQFGLTDWDRIGITVEDIERIEVVRGPAGAAYGSNAFAGAINIVTRDTLTSPGLEILATAGSAGTRLAGLRYRYTGERLAYTTAINYLESDGFANGNSEVAVTNLRWQARYQMSETQLLDFQVGQGSGPSGRGGRLPPIDPVGDKHVREQYSVLRLTSLTSAANEWYLQFGYNRTRQDDYNIVGTVENILSLQYQPDQLAEVLAPFPSDFAGEPVLSSPYDYHADRVDLEFQQTLALSHKSRLVWGVGGRQNRIKSHLALSRDDYIYDRSGRLYGNWEYRAGKFLYNFGAMFEYGDLASGNLSFRVGANYSLNDDHSLRASLARGWRHPFVGEAYHELALKTASGILIERALEVPETLESERIHTLELGYVGNWRDKALQTEVKFFAEKVCNEIQEQVDPFAPELLSLFSLGTVLRMNGGETDIVGFEGSADLKVTSSTRLRLSYALANVDQSLPPMAIRNFYANSGTPRHTASLLFMQDFGRGWQGSIGYYYLDDMAWYVWGGDTESYGRVDLRLAKQYSLGKQNITVELIGQNLGNSYSEFTPANRFDTRGFVRFRLEWD